MMLILHYLKFTGMQLHQESGSYQRAVIILTNKGAQVMASLPKIPPRGSPEEKSLLEKY